jgi:hypothetical protein
MIRLLSALVAAVFALVFSVAASADLVPPGFRSLEYSLVIEGLDAHPDWVFFVYPTSNYGFAYRLETGKGLSNLLMGPRAGQPASRVHAIPHAELDKQVGTPNAHPHGDEGEMLQVFPPPKRALVAGAEIAPPDRVREESPIRGVERVYRIARLGKDVFELALVREIEIMKDGSRVPKGGAPALAPPSVPTAHDDGSPRARGCGGCTSAVVEDGCGWWLLLAIAVASRRMRLARKR